MNTTANSTSIETYECIDGNPPFCIADKDDGTTLFDIFEGWGVTEKFPFPGQPIPANNHMVKIDGVWYPVIISMESNTVFLDLSHGYLPQLNNHQLTEGERAWWNYMRIQAEQSYKNDTYALYTHYRLEETLPSAQA